MTIEDRRTGWLIPVFYYKFRELLTHTLFRFGICCPIFCLMPDHLHLLWIGLIDSADQRLAMKFFRRQINLVLEKQGFQLQDQPYDHVLRDDERQPVAFQNVVEYIARNPERKHLVPPEGFRDYPFTGCLLPEYPDLNPFQSDFWPLFDSLTSKLRREGLTPPRSRSRQTSAVSVRSRFSGSAGTRERPVGQQEPGASALRLMK